MDNPKRKKLQKLDLQKTGKQVRKSRVSFLLECGELDTLERVTYLEPYLADTIQRARKKKEKNNYRISFNEEDFQEALDALSFQADWIQSQEEKECLMNLHEKISRYKVLGQGFRRAALSRLFQGD